MSIKFRKHAKRAPRTPLPAEVATIPELGGLCVVRTKDPKAPKLCVVIGNTVFINDSEDDKKVG